MLTIGVHGGSGGAAEYHEEHLQQDEYYVARPGRWHAGRAARALCLPRDVTSNHFRALAEGRGPDGQALVQRQGDKHREGWDLTFSAPKSVSVLWAQATSIQQAAIARAHERAVDRALLLLQTHAIQVRIGKGGSAHVPAQMVAALFTHETSRAHDPQLHTHAFLHNCGLRRDGRWGTLESRYLYQWQTVVGTAYRAQLSHELRLLGYGIREDKTAFAVVGVPERAVTAFARRRADIERAANSAGVSSPAAMEVVALGTRAKKVDVDQDALRQNWRDRGSALGFGPGEAKQLLGTRNDRVGAVDLDGALAHLTANKAVFRVQDLWRAVAEQVQHAGGDISRIERLVADVLRSQEIVSVVGERYTTRTMLALEQRAIADADCLAKRSGYSCSASNARRSLSDEQERAMVHVLGDSAIAVIEGRAGTGKSYTLGAALECWRHADRTVIGAALAGKAAQGLEEGSGIPSQTLHALLADIDGGRRRLDRNTVIVVDEAGMVGTAQMQRLLAAVASGSAKLVLVGDSRQLQSIDAGGVFRRMSRELGAAEIAEIRRQRRESDRAVVIDLMEGRAAEALARLDAAGCIHVLDGQPRVLAQMARDWLNVFDARCPAGTIMLAATRADVRALNTEARRQYREAGGLGEQEMRVGDSAFACGDRVLFLKNDRHMGVKNGTLGSVVALGDRSLTVKLDDGATISVPADVYPHLTHGYAMTCHKAQGVTADHVLVYLSDRMANREWGYVAGSRHRDSLHLYSDRSVYVGIADELSRSDVKLMALDEMARAGRLAPPIALDTDVVGVRSEWAAGGTGQAGRLEPDDETDNEWPPHLGVPAHEAPRDLEFGDDDTDLAAPAGETKCKIPQADEPPHRPAPG